MATAIMHMKHVEARLPLPLTDKAQTYEWTAQLDHIEYVGITIQDKKFVCMVCGADVLEINLVIQ